MLSNTPPELAVTDAAMPMPKLVFATRPVSDRHSDDSILVCPSETAELSHDVMSPALTIVTLVDPVLAEFAGSIETNELVWYDTDRLREDSELTEKMKVNCPDTPFPLRHETLESLVHRVEGVKQEAIAVDGERK